MFFQRVSRDREKKIEKRGIRRTGKTPALQWSPGRRGGDSGKVGKLWEFRRRASKKEEKRITSLKDAGEEKEPVRKEPFSLSRRVSQNHLTRKKKKEYRDLQTGNIHRKSLC